MVGKPTIGQTGWGATLNASLDELDAAVVAAQAAAAADATAKVAAFEATASATYSLRTVASEDAHTFAAPEVGDTHGGLLRFETRSDTYPEAPWIVQVGNAHTGEHDHVLYHLYNCRWDEVTNGWAREVEGEHALRYGFEARFADTVGGPDVARGSHEWNLDIALNLTGVPSFTKRPWFFYYDMDALATHLSVGAIDDRTRNTINLYGQIREAHSLSLMRADTGTTYFQFQNEADAALLDATGVLTLNKNGTAGVSIGQGGGTTKVWESLSMTRRDNGGGFFTIDREGTEVLVESQNGRLSLNKYGTGETFIGQGGGGLRVFGNVGFYGGAQQPKPTGVAVTAAGIHAALVTLGLIAA